MPQMACPPCPRVRRCPRVFEPVHLAFVTDKCTEDTDCIIGAKTECDKAASVCVELPAAGVHAPCSCDDNVIDSTTYTVKLQ